MATVVRGLALLLLWLAFLVLFQLCHHNDGDYSQGKDEATTGGIRIIQRSKSTAISYDTGNQCQVQFHEKEKRFSLQIDRAGDSATDDIASARYSIRRHQTLACPTHYRRGAHRKKNKALYHYMYPFDLHGCCAEHDHLDDGSVQCPALFGPSNAATTTRASAGAGFGTSSIVLENFLKVNRGKTLLFLGDSLTLQLFAAFGMALTGHEILFDYHVHSPTRRTIIIEPGSHSDESDQDMSNNNTSRTDSGKEAVTLELVEFYQIIPSNQSLATEETANNKDDFILHPNDPIMVEAIQNADIVIANTGLHASQSPQVHYQQLMDIQHLIQQENHARQNYAKNNKANPKQDKDICYLWRRTMPQHFPTTASSHNNADDPTVNTNNNTGLYEDRVDYYKELGCAPLGGGNGQYNPATQWKHPSDYAYQHPSSTTVLQGVLDFTSILQGASQLHSKHSPSDCAHYCYSSVIWIPMIHLITETIRRAC